VIIRAVTGRTSVTTSDEAVPKEAVLSSSNAEGRHVPVRARLTITERIRKLFSGVAEIWRQQTAKDRLVGSSSILSATPESISELRSYFREASWVPPGEKAPWLEKCGRFYGYLIAIPSTAALFIAAWLMQRPLRLTTALAMSLLLWLTH
jgi:hypothetical protein